MTEEEKLDLPVCTQIHVRFTISFVPAPPIPDGKRAETIPVHADELHDGAADGGEDAGGAEERGQEVESVAASAVLVSGFGVAGWCVEGSGCADVAAKWISISCPLF